MLQATLDFSDYIKCCTDGFTGREWVFAEIDRWLTNPEAPQIFLLTGEPGIGKTAIAARLTQFSNAVATPPAGCVQVGHDFLSAVHFCSARYGSWLAPDNLARSVSAQLAARYPAFAEAVAPDLRIHVEQHIGANLGTAVGAQITHYYAENAEVLFNNLVRLPLQALFQQGEPPESLVILVDGLDEALSYSGRPSIVRLLAACGDFPARVRLLLTSRPVDGVMAPFRALQPFTLLAHMEQNQEDIQAYVCHRFETSEALRERAGDQTKFRRVTGSLVTRSGGNFLVVSKVLDGLERGELGLDNPESLPADLQNLYAWFLDRLVKEDMRTWRELYRPVLGSLAVAQEPVDAPTLCRWSGLKPRQITDALHDLRELLKPALSGYRLYHESLTDFLTGDQAGAYRLVATEYHQQIADYYRGELCPWSEVNWNQADDYGKRYLTAHLYALKDFDALYALVESQAWTAAKYVDTPWAGSLIQDLRLASTAVGGEVGDWARAMGYQLRRALIESLMSHVSDRVILFLTRLGQVDRALDLARRQWNRFKLLREIAQIVAQAAPAKAVEILAEFAHLMDDESISGQYQFRLVAAQEIIRLAPTSSRMALDLMQEAESLVQALPASDLVKHQVTWYLPTLALSGELVAALAASENLAPLQQAQALRHISAALPEAHPSKKSLAEQALYTLESLEQTPETLSERIRAIVALLPLVDESERRQWLNLLEATGTSLRSIEAPVDYAAMPHWAIGRVAAIDLDWARRMLLESNWGSPPDTLYEVTKEIAKDDYEEALRLVRDQFSNHILTPNLLIHIIDIVAAEDPDKAGALIEEYTQYLRDNKSDAHIAVAEAYLARGDIQKAREIFDKHAVFADREGFAHARENIQLAILARSSFLPVEVVRERLMQFPTCPRCHRSQKQDAEVVLARMAARQNKIDFLEQYCFGQKAQLNAAYDLADYVGPEAARRYLERQHIGSFSSQDAKEVYAHIAAVEAEQEPGKLGVLLEHFGNGGKPHDFCAYMRELPYALQKLVETRRIEPAEAISIIERLCSLLINWKCPGGKQPPEDEFWKTQCNCYDNSEQALVQLIGLMAQLNPERSEEMVSALPAQPIRAYALKQVLHHTQAYERLVSSVITTGRECIKDPWQRAEFYYTLATSLPAEMSDTIKHLIELAKPLLSESPTEYHTNKFGLPVRVGPSSKGLKIRKAQALMRLVRDVSQFAYVPASLKAIEDLLQVDDKLQVLGQLARQAAEWSKGDQLALLWRIWEEATTRRLVDTRTFIAASVPLTYAVGGEEAFWRLYHYVEWAYDDLPQADELME
jgi:hypothetical protein